MRVTFRQWGCDSALYPLELQLSQNSEFHTRRLIRKAARSAGKAKSYYQEFMLLEVGEEVVLQSMNEIGAN